jgi:hypothetical protein
VQRDALVLPGSTTNLSTGAGLSSEKRDAKNGHQAEPMFFLRFSFEMKNRCAERCHANDLMDAAVAREVATTFTLV